MVAAAGRTLVAPFSIRCEWARSEMDVDQRLEEKLRRQLMCLTLLLLGSISSLSPPFFQSPFLPSFLRRLQLFFSIDSHCIAISSSSHSSASLPLTKESKMFGFGFHPVMLTNNSNNNKEHYPVFQLFFCYCSHQVILNWCTPHEEDVGQFLSFPLLDRRRRLI